MIDIASTDHSLEPYMCLHCVLEFGNPLFDLLLFYRLAVLTIEKARAHGRDHKEALPQLKQLKLEEGGKQAQAGLTHRSFEAIQSPVQETSDGSRFQ